MDTEALIQKDMCTPMFIATLCTIAKVWKQPKSPTIDDLIQKVVGYVFNGTLAPSSYKGTEMVFTY